MPQAVRAKVRENETYLAASIRLIPAPRPITSQASLPARLLIWPERSVPVAAPPSFFLLKCH